MGSFVCLFVFNLMESRNTPCLSAAVQSSLSRRECWLPLLAHSVYLYFLNRRRAKGGGALDSSWALLPCMQCLGPAEGHNDLMTIVGDQPLTAMHGQGHQTGQRALPRTQNKLQKGHLDSPFLEAHQPLPAARQFSLAAAALPRVLCALTRLLR